MGFIIIIFFFWNGISFRICVRSGAVGPPPSHPSPPLKWLSMNCFSRSSRCFIKKRLFASGRETARRLKQFLSRSPPPFPENCSHLWLHPFRSQQHPRKLKARLVFPMSYFPWSVLEMRSAWSWPWGVTGRGGFHQWLPRPQEEISGRHSPSGNLTFSFFVYKARQEWCLQPLSTLKR